MAQVSDAHLSAAADAQIHLVVEAQETPPAWQVVGNLVANAIRHSPRGSTFTVRLPLTV